MVSHVYDLIFHHVMTVAISDMQFEVESSMYFFFFHDQSNEELWSTKYQFQGLHVRRSPISFAFDGCLVLGIQKNLYMVGSAHMVSTRSIF